MAEPTMERLIKGHTQRYGVGPHRSAPVLIRAAMPRLLAERDPIARDHDLSLLGEATGYTRAALTSIIERWRRAPEAPAAAARDIRPPGFRPTVYSGIQMRSRLEATVAARLDRYAIAWDYEPSAFGGPGQQQWLPDFRLRFLNQVAYVEVKGSLTGAESSGGRLANRRALMTRMAVVWESEPAALLVIAEAAWEHDERNPARGSVWAARRVPGWSLAFLRRCKGCGYIELAPIKVASQVMYSRTLCCDDRSAGSLLIDLTKRLA